MNKLSNKIYRAIQKGLLEGLDLNGIDLEDLNDIKIDKVSSSTRSIQKAWKYEEDYKIQQLSEKLQSLIDSGKYKIRTVKKLVDKGAIYKVNNDNLKKIINEYIEFEGTDCDLNWIDTSEVTDMSNMFCQNQFNGDISKWDVSNVINMRCMFCASNFNGDISNWDVSNVKYMSCMFSESQFNGDISKWDVSNVKDMSFMFNRSPFNRDISNWNISNFTNMSFMFDNCPIKEAYKPKF